MFPMIGKYFFISETIFNYSLPKIEMEYSVFRSASKIFLYCLTSDKTLQILACE